MNGGLTKTEQKGMAQTVITVVPGGDQMVNKDYNFVIIKGKDREKLCQVKQQLVEALLLGKVEFLSQPVACRFYAIGRDAKQRCGFFHAKI